MDGHFPAHGFHAGPFGDDVTAEQAAAQFAASHPQLNTSLWGLPEDILPQSPIGDSRGRLNGGYEVMKHRRSRKGCFTCRSRRVKCDETRPECERCRKAKRDCVFPEDSSGPKQSSKTSSNKKPPSQKSSSQKNEDSNSMDATSSNNTDRSSPAVSPLLSTVGNTPSPSSQPRLFGYSSFNISQSRDERPNERFDPASKAGLGHQPLATYESLAQDHDKAARFSRWSDVARQKCWNIDKDLRFYIEFHQTHISKHHYGLRVDTEDFIHGYFLDQALTNEPLLYAVVAFSSYIHSFQVSDAKLETFLGYYTKSITLLRDSLQKSEQVSIASVLTMIQLALLEEYLGDWLKQLEHARTAVAIIERLLDPETFVKKLHLRKIVELCTRFDLYGSFISGSNTDLDRKFYQYLYDFSVEQAQHNPESLVCQYELQASWTRIIAKDLCILFAEASADTISEEEFDVRSEELADRIKCWKTTFPQILIDPAHAIQDLPPSTLPIDTTNLPLAELPVERFQAYEGDLWTTNHLLVLFWAVELMFNHLLVLIGKRERHDENIAINICKTFELIDKTDGEPGATAGLLGPIVPASLVITRDNKRNPTPERITWCRKALASLSIKHGYLYNTAIKTRMAGVWGEEVGRFWLPEEDEELDGEITRLKSNDTANSFGLEPLTYPPFMKKIYNWLDERSTVPRDKLGEELLHMRGQLSNMELSPSKSPPARSP